jgi:hypothetical protein
VAPQLKALSVKLHALVRRLRDTGDLCHEVGDALYQVADDCQRGADKIEKGGNLD